MLQEGSIPCRTHNCKYRGLSTAIAGLIVLSFLLVIAIPLLLNIYAGSVQSHLALSNKLAEKLQEASQRLNITYDLSRSSPPSLRVYIVRNNGPSDVPISFYIVTDGSKTYLVKAVNTYNKTLGLGSVEIMTEPVSGVSLLRNTIVIKPPRGEILIRVKNGKLVGAIAVAKGYAQVNVPTSSGGMLTTYAEVAESIKTNYVNLTMFNNITDFFSHSNDSNIVITNNPTENQSNTTLLNRGAFQTICFTGNIGYDEASVGGFQPADPKVNASPIAAVYIHNMGIWPGSMVLGGKDTSYNSNAIHFSLYMAGYDLIAYNQSEPGFIAISMKDGEHAFCYSFVVEDKKAVSDCMPEGSENWNSSSVVSSKLYDVVAEQAQLKPSENKESYNLSSIFNIVYSRKLGLVLWKSDFVAYCPPNSFSINNISVGSYMFKITGTCWFAYKEEERVYEGNLSNSLLEVINAQTIYGDRDTGIKGIANGTIRYTIKYETQPEEIKEDKNFPTVIKLTNIMGDKNLLSIYDNVTGKIRRGVKAFGVYLYGGEHFETMSGEYYIYYYIYNLYGEDGRLSIFEFKRGDTSGLRPYMLLADTDGNGLSEIVLIDEWFSPDSSKHSDQSLADIIGQAGKTYHPAAGNDDLSKYEKYGCVEKSIGYFYLKFRGPYAINGSRIAEVSIQVRYSFHDNLATDLEEVDNQMAGIWGFAVLDSNGNETASSMYIYQQLQNYEYTWPVSMPFHSDAVYLPIPNKPELYFIVFKFGDPYSFYVDKDGNIEAHDDADMTIRIEWLGMWYLHR